MQRKNLRQGYSKHPNRFCICTAWKQGTILDDQTAQKQSQKSLSATQTEPCSTSAKTVTILEQ
jgi:hypothetical protein